MFKNITAAICVSFLAVTSGEGIASETVSENMRFRAYVSGLPLGELKLGIKRAPGRYEADADFEMASLLRWILDTDAKASVAGNVSDSGPRPVRFEFFVRDRDERSITEMLFNAVGNVYELNAVPPLRKKSYGMTLDEAAGAVDPATAVVMLASPRVEPCKFDMEVFDGAKRHRIRLLEKISEKDGTITCKGRYDRVAGFKAKYMTPERRTYPFKTSLVQTAEGEWRPVRVWAKTKFGAAVVRRLD